MTGSARLRTRCRAIQYSAAGIVRANTALLDAILVKHLEQFMIVAVVDMDTDDHRTLRLERLLHDRSDVVGLVDHETRRAECFGIFDVVDWTEVDSRSAAVFELLLNGYHVVPAVDPDHVDDVRLEAHGRLQFHGGIEEAAITGDRENLLRGPDDRSCDAPGKGDAQGLLAVRDKDLTGFEAIEMARDPQVERTHVQAECNVTAKELLQFVDEAQWMDRCTAASSCFLAQQPAFGANHLQDSRGERRFLRPLKVRSQGLQGLC